MLKSRITLLALLLISAQTAWGNQQQPDDDATAKNVALIEGVLAAPLSSYSSYELAHKDDIDTTILSAATAFLRTAHGVTFQVNHQRTYLGLKIIMALLTAYDAGTFVHRYKQLTSHRAPADKPSTTETQKAPPKPAPAKSSDKSAAKMTNAYATPENIFSDKIHTIAHQVELAAALVLAMSSSHKASALRCEYAACLALLTARAVTIAEQHRSWAIRLLLISVLSLMALDFAVPNSPFNSFAAEREKEFDDYLDLQADIGSCMKQLNQMHTMVDNALAAQINRPQHEWLSSMAAAINKNRANLRATMCASGVSLSEAESILADAQAFYNQKIAGVTNAYHSVTQCA